MHIRLCQQWGVNTSSAIKIWMSKSTQSEAAWKSIFGMRLGGWWNICFDWAILRLPWGVEEQWNEDGSTKGSV